MFRSSSSSPGFKAYLPFIVVVLIVAGLITGIVLWLVPPSKNGDSSSSSGGGGSTSTGGSLTSVIAMENYDVVPGICRNPYNDNTAAEIRPYGLRVQAVLDRLPNYLIGANTVIYGKASGDWHHSVINALVVSWREDLLYEDNDSPVDTMMFYYSPHILENGVHTFKLSAYNYKNPISAGNGIEKLDCEECLTIWPKGAGSLKACK